jgi:hypothetical protein
MPVWVFGSIQPYSQIISYGRGVDCTWLEMLAWVIQQEGVEVYLGNWVTPINGVFWDQFSDECYSTRVEKIALLSHEPPMLTAFCPPSWTGKRIIAATKRELFNKWRKSMLEQLRGSVRPAEVFGGVGSLW